MKTTFNTLVVSSNSFFGNFGFCVCMKHYYIYVESRSYLLFYWKLLLTSLLIFYNNILCTQGWLKWIFDVTNKSFYQSYNIMGIFKIVSKSTKIILHPANVSWLHNKFHFILFATRIWTLQDQRRTCQPSTEIMYATKLTEEIMASETFNKIHSRKLPNEYWVLITSSTTGCRYASTPSSITLYSNFSSTRHP